MIFPVHLKGNLMQKTAKMKYLIVGFGVAVLGISPSALADGFFCTGDDTGTEFTIYHQTDRDQGTRKVSTLTVSEPSAQLEDQTIATFSDAKNTVTNSGTNYTAKVDLRVAESRDADKQIAGTTLGNLEKIQVAVYFNYFQDTPSYSGEKFKGQVEYFKRDGDSVKESLHCSRYLKH